MKLMAFACTYQGRSRWVDWGGGFVKSDWWYFLEGERMAF